MPTVIPVPTEPESNNETNSEAAGVTPVSTDSISAATVTSNLTNGAQVTTPAAGPDPVLPAKGTTSGAETPKMEPMVPYTPEVAKPAKKFGIVKVILLALAVILLIGGAIGGYGLYNAKRIRDYAQKSEKWMDKANDWSAAFDTADAKTVQEKMETVVADARSLESEVDRSNPPAKAKKLKDNLKEYFSLSLSLGKKMEDIAVWVATVTDIGKDVTDTSANMSLDSADSMVASLESIKASMQKSYDKLNAPDFAVPDSVKKQNEDVKEMLKIMIAAYDKLIQGIKTNNSALVNESMTDLLSAVDKVTALDASNKQFDEFKAEADKADQLEKDIKSQISSLKPVMFSF
jgi:hypothetical protein